MPLFRIEIDGLYHFRLQHAKETQDESAIKQLQNFDKNAPDFPSMDYMRIRSLLLDKYRVGLIHGEPISTFAISKMIMLFKGYTFSEKNKYLRGSIFSLTAMCYKVIECNLMESTTNFQIPVYMAQGEYDYQVSDKLACEWFDLVEAPTEEFFTFENSAHGTIIEEPEKFVQTICKITETLKSIAL